MEFYSGLITNITENEIVVFGSNPEGRHGAGAAKFALNNFGAIYGNGRGRQGNSYALITKNLKAGFVEKKTGILYPTAGAKSISIHHLIDNIKELYQYALDNPELKFKVAYTNDNNNLNGYTSIEMFKMFLKAGNDKIPVNFSFHDSFKDLYSKLTKKNKIIDFKITVTNIKKNPDIKSDSKYIYCGRGSALGNPFSMNNYSQEERDRVCVEYDKYINQTLTDTDKRNQLNKIWKTGLENGEVILGCYCAPQRCHCDTIKQILQDKQQELNNKKKTKSAPKTK